MYRGGLIFGAIGQVILTIILVAIAIAWPSINNVVGNGLVDGSVSGSGVTYFGDLGNNVATTTSFSSVSDTISIVLGIVAAIQFIFTFITFAALSNFEKAKRCEREFNSGLAVAAGVLNLLGNIIAGILILVGISDAKREVGENTSQGRRQSYRGQDDYPDRRGYRRPEHRTNGYSREEHRPFDDERPRKRR